MATQITPPAHNRDPAGPAAQIDRLMSDGQFRTVGEVQAAIGIKYPSRARAILDGDALAHLWG